MLSEALLETEVYKYYTVDNFGYTIPGIIPSIVEATDEFQFQIRKITSQTVLGVSIVVHASTTGAIIPGLVINLFMGCNNSTSVHLIHSYTTNESDAEKEWLELNPNISGMPSSIIIQCSFSINIAGNSSSLDAILVLYDYSPYERTDIYMQKTVQKRTADVLNRTLLSDYIGDNCSVHSVYLRYGEEFPIGTFDRAERVISPDPTGINITFCTGECNFEYSTQAVNITNPKRWHFMGDMSRNVNSTTLPKVCCIAETFQPRNLIVSDRDAAQISMHTFPQVTKCKCII